MPIPSFWELKPLHCLVGRWQVSTLDAVRVWAGGHVCPQARVRGLRAASRDFYKKGWTVWTLGHFNNRSKGLQ